MTNTELLNKLEKQKPYVSAQGTAYNNISALQSVIEIHKPIHSEKFDYTYCEGCEKEIPCPTIQAIEKELQ